MSSWVASMCLLMVALMKRSISTGGLKQGDTLTSFFFLLVVKGLSELVRRLFLRGCLPTSSWVILVLLFTTFSMQTIPWLLVKLFSISSMK